MDQKGANCWVGSQEDQDDWESWADQTMALVDQDQWNQGALQGPLLSQTELQIVAAPGHLVPSRFRDHQ